MYALTQDSLFSECSYKRCVTEQTNQRTKLTVMLNRIIAGNYSNCGCKTEFSVFCTIFCIHHSAMSMEMSMILIFKKHIHWHRKVLKRTASDQIIEYERRTVETLVGKHKEHVGEIKKAHTTKSLILPVQMRSFEL